MTATNAAIFFGRCDRPLFGWLGLPEGTPRHAILLCSPLGYEGLFIQPTFRQLLARLIVCGHAVLRFGYEGLDESAGSDEEPGRVAAWCGSIEQGIDELKRRSGLERVILCGVRAGGTLAAWVSRRRTDVEAIILWNPCVAGRAFVREMRALSLLSYYTAAGRTDEAADGLEANGYLFTSDTVEALGAIDLLRCKEFAPPRALVLEQERVAAHLRVLGCEVTYRAAPDYGAMMQPSASTRLPLESFAAIEQWLAEVPGADVTDSSRVTEPGEPTAGRVSESVEELPVFYDRTSRLFGMLARPVNGRPRTGVVFLNNANGSRVGPHAMYVSISRSLAEMGIAAFRIDVGGLGDSPLPPDREPHHPYRMDHIPDVVQAIRVIRSYGVERVALAGLCSGAYLAYHTALESASVDKLILINLQTFAWREGDSLDVSPLEDHYEMERYRRSVISKEKWLKLLRGGVDLRHLSSVLANRARFVFGARFHALRTMLPFGGAGPVGEALNRLAERGTEVLFVFSGRDPGIANLQRELGSRLPRLLRGNKLRMTVIDGPDHSFTPRWATRKLLSTLAEELNRQ